MVSVVPDIAEMTLRNGIFDEDWKPGRKGFDKLSLKLRGF